MAVDLGTVVVALDPGTVVVVLDPGTVAVALDLETVVEVDLVKINTKLLLLIINKLKS